MATDTLQDNVLLSGLFDRAFSPVATAGQGLIEKAMLDRRRAEREEDIAISLKFQAARDKAQEAHAERIIDMQAKAHAKEREEEFKRLSAAKREEARIEAIARARARGITISDDATYQVATQELAKSYGREKVAAANQVAGALGKYAEYLDKTQQEVMSESMALAIANITEKERKAAGLELADINKLITNPSAMADMRAKALRDNNREAFALLNKINASSAASITEGMKAAGENRPAMKELASQFDLAKKNFEDISKLGASDEASSIEATKALLQSVRQGPAQAAPAGPPRTINLLGPRAAPAVAPTAARPQTLSSGIVGPYDIGAAVNKWVTPYVMPALGAIVNSPYPTTPAAPQAPQAPVFAPPQTFQPNPELRSFLERLSIQQNTNTPTAFPGNTNQPALPFGFYP